MVVDFQKLVTVCLFCYCDRPTPINFVINIIFLSVQEVDVRLLCVKGIGQDHAKFSPVGKSLYCG